MLSDHHLRANLEALASAGTPAPAFGRVNPERLRVVERKGDTHIAIRTAGREWVVLDDEPPADLLDLHASSAATVCLIGTRSGRMIDAVEARRPGVRIVAVEPDPLHAAVVLACRDWREALASGRLVFLIGPHYGGASSIAPRIDVSSPPLVVLDPPLAVHCASAVRSARALVERICAESRANADARRVFAPRYLQQTLQNLPAIVGAGDAASLDGRFPGIPAVVVGAGPSLDRNAEELASLADRCLIVASDTALRPLQAAGIAAPIVVAVDPSEWNARHLTGRLPFEHTWLVAEGSLYPETLTRFTGRTFTFEVSGHEPWPWLRTHGLARGRLRAWGSVLTSAFDLALRMGCNPIVFAGADLAFTGGRTYLQAHGARGHLGPVDRRGRYVGEHLAISRRPATRSPRDHRPGGARDADDAVSRCLQELARGTDRSRARGAHAS